ncbi:MAG: hypothetical protein ABIX10_10330 [Acidimicrobiales bacterium]
MTAILAAAIGATVVLSQRLEGSGDSGDQVVSGPDVAAAPGAASSTTGEPTVARPAGQVQVSGTVTAVHLEGAVIDPHTVATPLTIVSDRGFGNGGELAGVEVEGTGATVVWDGGRPFMLSSGGSMILDPVNLDLVTEGLRLALGGSVQAFTPGTYRLDTPVAVGTRGVAAARDSVTFDANDRSSFATRGDAALFLSPDAPRHLLGPGLVHLEGALEVVAADGSRRATILDAAAAAFDITLSPIPGGGWSITAILQGEVVAV